VPGDEDPRAAGHVSEGGVARVKEDAEGAGPSAEGAPQPRHSGPPRVEDVPLREAEPQLHERIRTVLHRHKAMWSGQAMGAIKATRHHIELAPGAKPVRVPPWRGTQGPRGGSRRDRAPAGGRRHRADVVRMGVPRGVGAQKGR